MRFLSKNGNLTISPGYEDEKVIGNPNPICSVSWYNALKYKSFELSFLFRGSIGNDALNYNRFAYGYTYGLSNVYMKDIAVDGQIRTGLFSSYFLEDASYFKLANIALQYDIPLKNRKYLSSCKIYFAAQNVFTITKYSGSDPEIANPLFSYQGIQIDYYPTFRNYMLGIKISFL
jgi:iron complex outermembrane receptor protein